MVQEFVKVAEVARLFDVSPQTVRNWIEIGQLKAIRPCGSRGYRINQAEVDRMLNQVTQPNG